MSRTFQSISLWHIVEKEYGTSLWSTWDFLVGAQRWRNSVFDEYGISRELLDGQIPNLQRIFKMYLGDHYAGKRVVLAVDAAGVSPRVIVRKNGQIDGFLNEDASVPEEQATVLRSSLQHLRQFVTEHHRDIVKDFFVVFVCPLESLHGGFPIFLYPKGNGAADQ